jgi:hypothetical protein
MKFLEELGNIPLDNSGRVGPLERFTFSLSKTKGKKVDISFLKCPLTNKLSLYGYTLNKPGSKFSKRLEVDLVNDDVFLGVIKRHIPEEFLQEPVKRKTKKTIAKKSTKKSTKKVNDE